MSKPISNRNNSGTISGFFERVRLNQEKIRSNPKSHYDLIVCGSGSSGSVLAPQRESEGEKDWIRCEAGSLLILPPNSLRAFYNKTSEPCHVLGTSTQLHQAFFDAVASVDKNRPFASFPFAEAMSLIARIGAQHNSYFAPVDVSKSVGQY